MEEKIKVQTPRSYAFQKEQINRQNQHIHISSYKYQQNCKSKPIAGKFWSKHALDFPLKQEKLKENYQLLHHHLNYGPREKYKSPILDSHNYGWFHQHRIVYDENDQKLFCYPMKYNEITRIGEKLTVERVTLRPAFGGVPFKLQ